MNTTYIDANEKYVAAVTLYGHSDTYLYMDEGHTTKVGKDTVLNLCRKGLLSVVYNGYTCAPVCFKENSGYAEVTVATGTTTLTGAVLYSEEKAAG